jgi:excisionase family DNA binding protein
VADDEKWLSLSEAADRLSMSKDTVRRRAEEGLIRSRWTRPPRGGQRQYLESSVEAYRIEMEAEAAGDG